MLWAEMSPSPVSLHQNFGRVLRRVGIKVGMSQERLALECDLDRTFISLLERGLRQPTLTTLVVLARALDLEPAELVRQTMARSDDYRRHYGDGANGYL